MRLLFIGFHYYKPCGGQVCSNMNLQIVKELFGTKNVYEFRVKRAQYKSHMGVFERYLKGFWTDIRMCSIGGYDSIQEKRILDIISQNKISIVFIDNSALGNLAKKIKRHFPQVRVITFFHNVEYIYAVKELRANKNYYFYYRNYIIKRNEKNACLFSDKIITLHKRDTEIIRTLYGRESEVEIPIVIKDSYKYSNDVKEKSVSEKKGLFVGSYFSLNVQGLSNFIKEVLPHVNMKLIVVGAGMNELKKQYEENDKLEIHDFVENLAGFYEKVDFMVMPIWSGSGMKVKTAEALMFGKYVLGTQEAFIGYNINPQIGVICENNEAFIRVINSFKIRAVKYNSFSRELYLQNHSYEVALERFKKLFNSLQIN